MANSNANFVDYHSKIKTFNLFNIFYHDYEKRKKRQKTRESQLFTSFRTLSRFYLASLIIFSYKPKMDCP